MRGELELGGADPRRAADYFRAALRADPEDRDALHGLGMALRTLGDPQARKYLEIADRHDKLRRLIQDSVATIQTDPRLFFKLGRSANRSSGSMRPRPGIQLAIRRDPLDEGRSKPWPEPIKPP